jgi:hypothetical protein
MAVVPLLLSMEEYRGRRDPYPGIEHFSHVLPAGSFDHCLPVCSADPRRAGPRHPPRAMLNSGGGSPRSSRRALITTRGSTLTGSPVADRLGRRARDCRVGAGGAPLDSGGVRQPNTGDVPSAENPASCGRAFSRPRVARLGHCAGKAYGGYASGNLPPHFSPSELSQISGLTPLSFPCSSCP